MKSMGPRLFLLFLISSFLPGCGSRAQEGETEMLPDTLSRVERLQTALGILAADSMEGRETGSRGSAMAADFIAGELERAGLEPAFDGGYLQPVGLIRYTDERGRRRLALAGSEIPEGATEVEETADVNVGGLIRGKDPHREGELVVVSAHFDHVGIRAPRPGTSAEAEGDSICNGADDDGTGVVAVLEMARSMVQDGPGDRSVLFLLVTGEEMGLLGSRWYLQHPVFPVENTVANLNLEMLGRPGPEYGGEGRGWLTGFERSTMGEIFTDAGLSIIPEATKEGSLFFGSDNFAFALEGIVAHSVSSSDLHADYHTPDDEVDRIEFGSMTTVVETLIDALRLLTDGEAPVWKEGGRPEPRGGRR